MPDDPLREAAAIADPLERARVLQQLQADHQEISNRAARLRKVAIEAAVSGGMSKAEVARALGRSAGLITQLTAPPPPVITGWLAPPAAPGTALLRVALCGSHAAGTDGEMITAARAALAEVLMHARVQVSNGPVGFGIETLTYIADHYRPPGLSELRGTIGHDNLMRGIELMVLVGGGSGTQAEVDLAIGQDTHLLPMPLSGGTAAATYAVMERTKRLRAWLPPEDFAALASADADAFAQLLTNAIRSAGGDKHG
jgi:hypothetical protein